MYKYNLYEVKEDIKSDPIPFTSNKSFDLLTTKDLAKKLGYSPSGHFLYDFDSDSKTLNIYDVDANGEWKESLLFVITLEK